MPKPVVIGSNDDLDACSSIGLVSSLKANGFLAVRTGPTVKNISIDKLRNGQKIYICQISEDRNWYAIVYTKINTIDCGVSIPVNPAKAYDGKCKSGWVNAHWIKMLAG